MSATVAVQTKERPILFSGPMVRAILEDRKTQTQRVVKPQPTVALYQGTVPTFCSTGFPLDSRGYSREQLTRFCPYGKPGDRLWVRENFWERPYRTPKMMREGADTWPKVIYDADEDAGTREQWKEWEWKRKPSIFMFRHLSRITLAITNIRVERLQEISGKDAVAEGVGNRLMQEQFADSIIAQEVAAKEFAQGWNKINGKRKGCDWNSNPWVWIVEFKKL